MDIELKLAKYLRQQLAQKAAAVLLSLLVV